MGENSQAFFLSSYTVINLEDVEGREMVQLSVSCNCVVKGVWRPRRIYHLTRRAANVECETRRAMNRIRSNSTSSIGSFFKNDISVYLI